jgi:hypothetical protein
MKSKINKSKKGQALLIIIVVTSIALLILIAMANRILISRVNVDRSGEFERSLSIAENKVNEIIRILDGDAIAFSACLGSINSTGATNFQEITCNQLVSDDTRIYARYSPDATITVGRSNPLTHIVGTPSSPRPVSGVVITCSGSHRFVVTRGYVTIPNAPMQTDKAVFTCGTNTGSNARGNVSFYDATAASRELPIISGPLQANPTTRQTVFIRVKPYLDDQLPVDINISTYNSAGALQSSTAKYEFLVTGSGNIGSDSAVTFERTLSGNASFLSSVFDYAYFGDI